jgi:membrane protein YqaA with SNARE-associated domain
MKEIVLYGIAAVSSLVILGYSVHMFVGGLVSRETEILMVAAACTLGAVVIGVMAWDVVRRRRQSR